MSSPRTPVCVTPRRWHRQERAYFSSPPDAARRYDTPAGQTDDHKHHPTGCRYNPRADVPSSQMALALRQSHRKSTSVNNCWHRRPVGMDDGHPDPHPERWHQTRVRRPSDSLVRDVIRRRPMGENHICRGCCRTPTRSGGCLCLCPEYSAS